MIGRLESDLAILAAAWLESEGWSLYYEVSLEWQLRGKHELGDARADMVGTRGEQLCVLETKRDLSFDLFAQAKRWIPYADLVWVAVNEAKRSDGRSEAFQIAREYYGIGVVQFGESGEASVRVGPRLGHRRESDALLISLQPEHKNHARPGTNRGGQWTSFKRTADAIAKYVSQHPEGCTLEEAIEATAHHYASKRGALESMRGNLKRGLVPGVMIGWRQKLYPVSVVVEEYS